ncbi:hypothetical protein A2U01_0049835, partial [Trifolium medium]|nr:hypothetical protein [Trifolium medium]
QKGISLADDYPLVYWKQLCPANPGGVRYRIKGFKVIVCAPYDEDSLKKVVARQPVAVSLCVREKFFNYTEVVTDK